MQCDAHDAERLDFDLRTRKTNKQAKSVHDYFLTARRLLMVTQLETVLSRTASDGGRIWKTLSAYFEDGCLQRLREVSQGLREVVDGEPGRQFRRICINAPLADDTSIESLRSVAPFCYDLTITIGHPAHEYAATRSRLPTVRHQSPKDWFAGANLQMPSSVWRRRQQGVDCTKNVPHLHLDRSSDSPLQNGEHAQSSSQSSGLVTSPADQRSDSRRLWIQILSYFRQLRTLTLCVDGDRGWPGRTAVEDLLIDLRIALESAELENLRSFSLNPVHAMGVVHLVWNGIRAFGSTPTSGAAMWLRIETLELRINVSFAATTLTGPQQLMFKKILYNYLRSFAPSLRCLRFIWLGREGPNPLALHYEKGLEDRSGIKWPNLEELWIGNVEMPNHTIALVREFAQAKTKIRILRSTRRDSSMETGDSTAWVELLGGTTSSVRSATADRDSSVYSQDDECVGSEWDGGISRSSQDLTIMLRQ